MSQEHAGRRGRSEPATATRTRERDAPPERGAEEEKEGTNKERRKTAKERKHGEDDGRTGHHGPRVEKTHESGVEGSRKTAVMR